MSHEPDRQEAGMLVLTRKQSQQIVIGRDIRITIVKLDRNQVRLGIDAPPGMTILREELVTRGGHDSTCDEKNEWHHSRAD
jgi:carbon storage regulator